eukprot:TRINITY_DN1335_c0_g2_i1.p2 TRINITY_DN1335_c0_g2~~TRINITY_DN1335_c0_g2_i1.p2  ORF type:complete len:108 (+),score=36.30 TRINITY_DN1335_c0_g2_i1:383-706(+)
MTQAELITNYTTWVKMLEAENTKLRNDRDELIKEVDRLNDTVEKLNTTVLGEELQKTLYERVMNVYLEQFKIKNKAAREYEFAAASKEISNVFLYSALGLKKVCTSD